MHFMIELCSLCKVSDLKEYSHSVLQVLSDDEKRSLNDKFGEAGLKGAGMGMGVS